METTRKVSGDFRRQLARELADWQAEGVIAPEQAGLLAERYQLSQIARESTALLMMAIYVLGSILIGAGVISFVAFHWDAIPRTGKVVLLVVAMLAAHGAGIYLWKVAGREWLGHSLIFLGTLIFGANIGLLAQIFHIESDFYDGFGAWAIGALAVAYVMGSTPNALVAIAASFVWFCGWTNDHPHALNLYPFVATAVFLPFVYWRHSMVTFVATALAITAGVLAVAGSQGGGWAFTMAAFVMAMLFFAWGELSEESERGRGFGAAAGLALIGLALLCYVMSFHDSAREIIRDMQSGRNWSDLKWTLPAGLSALAGVGAWALLLRPSMQPGQRAIHWGVLTAGLLGLAAACVPDPACSGDRWVGYTSYAPVVNTILFNLALVTLAAGLTAGGVMLGQRGVFWLGILLAAADIAGRFFEYETGLLAKSAAFLACGVGVIVAGVRFEGYLRGRLIHDSDAK